MLQSLNTAQTGLKVSQTQVDGVLNNLANENTAGYKTRTVNVGELAQNDLRETGRGAVVQGVTRSTNEYMYHNLLTENSKNNSLSELDIMLEDIESIFFETEDSGLSADLNRYFNSIENLRTSPYNEIYKNELKNNANILIDTMKTLYSDIETREATTLANAEENVDAVNGILKNIAALNDEIINSTVTPHDLYDRRDLLENELSQYVDIEVSKDRTYNLSIGGVTAVGHDTNNREMMIVEDYHTQKDYYTLENTTGNVTSIVDTSAASTWVNYEETQTLTITGTATGEVNFLGTYIPDSVAHGYPSTAAETATDIEAEKANIMILWNANNPTKQISDIVVDLVTDPTGETLLITYDNMMGDVPTIPEATSNGIDFDVSVETQKGSVPSVTYTLDKETSITVTYGEIITDANGNPIDLDGSTVAGDAGDVVTKDTVIRALVYKINDLADTNNKIQAYNGDYTLDNNGNKVLMDQTSDHYLVIEAKKEGDAGKFTGEILVYDEHAGYTYDDDNDTSTAEISSPATFITKNSIQSEDPLDNIYLSMIDEDEEVQLSQGSLKSMVDNIQTDAADNKYQSYKDMLDNFAKALVDLSNTYIENDDLTYVYGTNAVELNEIREQRVDIDLFKGSSVNSLSFNDSMVNTLTQEKLDYLAGIQWKEDVDFDGTGQNVTSFYTFYEELRVNIADDRENVRFRKDSQEAITEALQKNYDKVTKVDKDEEMIELIKFQSAYEANAKMVTVVDEMLQTILGMKR
ncbi:MAG: flagellar basal body rod C-terminal domain-containing protein [Campylobacterota bacterium]|nr:flagellar basal body rod C-terminal domain-containing protein [Campylobacterota bacterium]